MVRKRIVRRLNKIKVPTILLISYASFISGCKSEGESYCGNTNKYKTEEIKKLDLYRETAVVKLGAFKVADHLPLKNGDVNTDAFFELKTLNDADKDDIFEILVNYDFSVTDIKSIKKTVVFCYDPRNAILFFDAKGQVIAYVELCFECWGYKTQPSALKVGEFCDQKFEVLRDLFSKNGITYGITNTTHNDQLESLSKSLREHPNNPIILTSIAQLKMKENNFQEAIKLLDKVIEIDSSSRFACLFRGQSKLALKDFEGARKDFDRVLKRHPNVTQAYHDRALTVIEIFKITQDKQLLSAICSDLEMLESSGDSSVGSLRGQYCGDEFR